MSRRNGDRSRYNRVRKARIHARTRIRNLQKKLDVKEAGTGSKPEAAAG